MQTISTQTETTNPRRSLIFVPGSRPERFSRAERSGADMVCIDLEDTVIAEEKDIARHAALEFFATESCGPERVVRINAVSSVPGNLDLKAIATSDHLPQLVMLPKVEAAEDVLQAVTTLAGAEVELVAMIESPRGLINAVEIAESHPSMVSLMFGGADFCADMGAEICWDAMFYARSQLAVVAAAAGLQLIDMPCLVIDDSELLADETRRIQAMGFTTKSAIHPDQIAVIHQQFMPTDKALERARRILAASELAKGGAVLVDGMMVDRPIVLVAQRTLSRAGDKT